MVSFRDHVAMRVGYFSPWPYVECSSGNAVPSRKALYVFNIRLPTDGEPCCLDPPHAKLESI